MLKRTDALSSRGGDPRQHIGHEGTDSTLSFGAGHWSLVEFVACILATLPGNILPYRRVWQNYIVYAEYIADN
jgi:hypothetical protein